MLAPKMSVYKSLSGKILRNTRGINSLLNTWSYFFLTLISPVMIRNGNIAACSKHSRRLPGNKHNHRHRDTKVA